MCMYVVSLCVHTCMCVHVCMHVYMHMCMWAFVWVSAPGKYVYPQDFLILISHPQQKQTDYGLLCLHTKY